MSENLDLVRSIFADWERGDWTSATWAHPDIEFEFADGPSPGRVKGLTAMARTWRDYMTDWRDIRADPEEYRELDPERVLVFLDFIGRGRASGVEIARAHSRGANLFHIRTGKVTRLVLYFDRDRALADLGFSD
jgi:ketosteroid isomerase-like protein